MAEFVRRWLPVWGVVLAGALAVWMQRPPRPLPAAAPATEFAAGRAMADLDSLAREPHAIGTAAHARVRAYLLRRLRALGLRPRVQDTTVLLTGRGGPVLARVQNIVARQPGNRPGGRALLVLAHYDSQPHTPGAGDDAAGVVAVLETIRALRAGPPLARDVEWLLTDGEEAGLLGARAYAADTARLRRRIGLALNVEGRGNAGPSLAFEVSPGNGWVVREFARAAPYPRASSLFYEAYRRLPNDTDFTPLRQAGLMGLNFAFVGGYSYYHSPADTPARLDLASVQHHGSYLLSLVRHFGNLELAATAGPDYTFFNPLGNWLVRYPAGYDRALLALAALVVAAAAALARPQRGLRLGGLLAGLLAWLGAAPLAVGLAAGLLVASHVLNPTYAAFYGSTFYNALAYQLALLAGAGAALAATYALLARRLPADALVGGGLLAALLLAGGLAWVAPSGAYLLAWPVLAAGLAWGWRLRRPALAGVPATGADWLLLLPTALLLVPVGGLLLDVFGLSGLVLAAPLLLAVGWGLALPVLLPVLRQVGPGRPAATSRRALRPAWTLPALGLLGSAVAFGWGQLTSRPTPARPQQTQLYYVFDANAGRATWASTLPHPDAWLRQVLSRPQRGPLPGAATGQGWQQAAPTLSLPAPTAEVLADTTRAGRRTLRLLLRPGLANCPSLRLRLPGARPLRLRVAGQLLAPAALAGPGLELLAPPPGGTLFEAEVPAGAPLRLSLLARAVGLPPGAAPPLPAIYVPAPGFNSFTTQVLKEIAF